MYNTYNSNRFYWKFSFVALHLQLASIYVPGKLNCWIWSGFHFRVGVMFLGTWSVWIVVWNRNLREFPCTILQLSDSIYRKKSRVNSQFSDWCTKQNLFVYFSIILSIVDPQEQESTYRTSLMKIWDYHVM